MAVSRPLVILHLLSSPTTFLLICRCRSRTEVDHRTSRSDTPDGPVTLRVLQFTQLHVAPAAAFGDNPLTELHYFSNRDASHCSGLSEWRRPDLQDLCSYGCRCYVPAPLTADGCASCLSSHGAHAFGTHHVQKHFPGQPSPHNVRCYGTVRVGVNNGWLHAPVVMTATELHHCPS